MSTQGRWFRRASPQTSAPPVETTQDPALVTIRHLEDQIARRRDDIVASADRVTQAQRHAAELRARAEEQAAEAAEAARSAVLDAAREQAQRVETAGRRRAADIRATARRRHDASVRAVLEVVLGGPTGGRR